MASNAADHWFTAEGDHINLEQIQRFALERDQKDREDKTFYLCVFMAGQVEPRFYGWSYYAELARLVGASEEAIEYRLLGCSTAALLLFFKKCEPNSHAMAVHRAREMVESGRPMESAIAYLRRRKLNPKTIESAADQRLVQFLGNEWVGILWPDGEKAQAAE